MPSADWSADAATPLRIYFANLPNVARGAGQLTDNGVHLIARGYAYAAAALEAALGWDTSDREPLAAQQSEEFRQVIVEKNRLCFHSYRPQNDTYLRGFREYDQGNNAGELLEFLPLIRMQEEKIRELRKPRPKEESKSAPPSARQPVAEAPG